MLMNNRHFRKERKLEQQIYQTFLSIQWYVQNTRDVIEIGLVDVGSDTCLEFVRGRDLEEFRHLQAEINRVRLSIFSAEMQRIRTDAKVKVDTIVILVFFHF